jgi:hypothetical protein
MTLDTKKIKIPIKYKRYYDELNRKLKKYKPKNEFKNIKFKISNIESDNEDDFFPYKCYIEVYRNNIDTNLTESILFRNYLSTIICKYTIISISPLNKDESSRFSGMKGFNTINGLLNEILLQFRILYINK